MVERKSKSKRQTKPIYCIYCEGKTETFYLAKQLSNIKIVQAPSNAKKLVDKVMRDPKYEAYDVVYCVFDRDPESNRFEQLQAISTTFKDSKGKLVRVHSNPCFEVMFCVGTSAIPRGEMTSIQCEQEISKTWLNGEKYKKDPVCLDKICENHNLSFATICDNLETIHNQLGINDNNWATVSDAYSEIFRLRQHAKTDSMQ